MMHSKFLLVLLFFSACGPSQDSRKVLVDAGFRVQPLAPVDLSKSLLHAMNITPAGTCLQNQIYLAVHDHTTNEIVSSTPINLYSNLVAIPAATPVYTNANTDIDRAIDWIKNYSSITSPLEVTIPGGPHSYDIAIVGQFFSPKDTLNNATNSVGADGICDQGTTALPNVAQGASSIFGKTEVNSAQVGPVSVDVQVVETNPSGGTYTLTNHPGYFAQFDQGFTDSSATKTARLKSVNYLNNQISAQVDTGSAYTYYFPSIFPAPYQLIFSDTGGTYSSTALAPSICVGCSAIPNPVLISGSDSFTNGSVGLKTVLSGTVTGTMAISTNTVSFTAVNGVCTATLSVSGTNSMPGDNGVVSFTITSPNFIGTATLAVSGYTYGATTFTGSCPHLNPSGGYGIVPQ